MLNNEDYLNIFHEIKNSITLIGGSLQLVAKKHPEVNRFEYWNEAMSEISFLKNMVTQLSSARLCGHLNVMQINIYAFMHQIASSIRAFSWSSFNCNIVFEESLPLIELDPQLVKQAVINLVKNAYEAMGNNGTAVITVSCSDNYMHIAVTDQGGGLDPAFADHIFQPFITSKTGGSGLGLYIVQEILRRHGSECTVCNTQAGVKFSFSI